MKYKARLWVIAAAGGILTLIFFLGSMRHQERVQYLMRPESGAGNVEQPLQVEIQGKKHPFSVTLEEIPYEEKELQSKLESAAAKLEALFLNGNVDLQHITKAVQMPSLFPQTRISVQWHASSWEYLGPDGSVHNEGLKEAVPVKIQAILTLEKQSVEWERDAAIAPVEDPDVRQQLRALEYELSKIQQESSGKVELPSSVFGESVCWYQEADNRWLWMLGLTALTLLTVVFGQRKDEEAKRQQWERRMQMEYPEIVSRLSLYMGAGISTRKAWERIVGNYEEQTKDKKGNGAAYEEMRRTLHEMQSGVSEASAYERFGIRCRMSSYLKLGALLSQNLRKGTKNLAELLQEESREAFEDRKALARRLGEECESKLLLPMLLMLLTILIIIMYPAVASFQM